SDPTTGRDTGNANDDAGTGTQSAAIGGDNKDTTGDAAPRAAGSCSLSPTGSPRWPSALAWSLALGLFTIRRRARP
ncbi:MAG: hypothetical protein ABW321_33125, partial [Polyangiales bacterium]